jgi:SPP1 family predicted phage head-tail adaptor
MDTGKLNRRIQIQTQTTTQDAFGAPLPTWTTVYTCWANIAIQNSQLIYSTSEFVSKETHRITIRWTSSVIVSPNMRIVYTKNTTGVTKTLEIQSILNPDQGDEWMVLLAYELNAQE